MGLFAVNPRVWVVLVVLFGLGLARRLWKQWRSRRAAARAAQLTKRP